MKKGELKGGKIATPIREMLDSPFYNGVIFRCRDVKQAETTRMAALILRGRYHYDYRTSRKSNNLVVYKGSDIEEPSWFGVQLYSEDEFGGGD